jgi:hypothetical protein
MVADRRGLRRDAVTAGLVCAVSTSIATVVLAVTRSGANAADAVVYLLPTALGDALLAFAVLALVRRMLRTESLRAPHPVYTEIVVAGRRG